MITKEELVKAVPFIFHLTDKRNLDFVKKVGKLYSTVSLVEQSNAANKEELLTVRRPEHLSVKIDDNEIHIRDQRPLNAALDRCLTVGWTRKQYIYLLNSRVFFWPNIGRLRTHFSRYQLEQPIIMKVAINDALVKNPHLELCHLNSGATRPLGILGGRAPERGENTFVTIEHYEKGVNKIAEVTFPNEFTIPDRIEVSNSPDGEWTIF